MRYKVRLIAQGFSQVYRVNFIKPFAPTVRRESLRMFSIIVTSYNLKLHQIDVKAAYLTGDLWEENKEIYMWISKDIKVRKCDEELIYHIQKSLYELKQSAWLWNKWIVKYLKKHSFKNLNVDQSILQWDKEFLISIYINDLLLATYTTKVINWIKMILWSEFEMIDLDEAQIIIKLQIIWDWVRWTLQID